MIRHPRRSRAPIPIVLALIPILLSAVPAGCQRNGPDDSTEAPPSIVLITVDALVAGDLSAFGGSTATPHLAAFVERASVWRDVWTASPLTRPAVATYLTGLAPDRHGVRDDIGTPLADTTPTLATLLSKRGYATAAFPGTDFLGSGSGLLRGFEVVDDPPGILYGVTTWLPLATPFGEQVDHVKTWLASLSPDQPYFAWIHTSEPMLERMQRLAQDSPEWTVDGPDQDAGGETPEGSAVPPGTPEAEDPAAATAGEQGSEPTRSAVERLDDGLGALLQAIEGRGGNVAVVLAGTMGDPTGGANELPGPGFSLHERLVRVPVVARLPGSAVETTRDARWALDVPVTLAALGGVALPESEGVDLRESAPQRVLLTWSQATLDQLGWLPLRAARRGERKLVEGLETRTVQLDANGGESPTEAPPGDDLAEALARRAPPEAPQIALDVVRPLLEARGVVVDPAPLEGRRFGTPEQRLAVAEDVWRGRWAMRRPYTRRTLAAFRAVLEVDPQNLAASIGLGQMLVSAQGRGQSKEVLGKAVGWYPTHPEVVHWYAHAIWPDDWHEGERLIRVASDVRPRDGDLLYDLACARSLDGDIAGATDYLRRAIEAGFRQWEAMAVDPDLRNLRESGKFAEVVQEFRR